MPVKLKLGSVGKKIGTKHRILRGLAAAVLACVVFCAIVFGYIYLKYQKIVDDRLAAGPIFANVAQIYGAPREVRVGQHLSVTTVAQDLRSAGYNVNPKLGTFSVNGNSINIKPGPESYHSTDGATITTAPSRDDSGTGQSMSVTSIAADNGAALAAYELEPKLITALSEDKNRTKRRLVAYSEIPTQLVQAVTSIEDRKFFEHGGINYVSMVGWVWHDLIGDRKVRGGGSTLTMQLAKMLFVEPNRSNTFEYMRYKATQILVAFQLESRFSKKQIFEMYANQVPLGQRGSYAINGFGEASQVFFGKELRQLDVAECALLAGLIQSPSWRNPFMHKERAVTRRNIVLDSMVDTGALTEAQAVRAKAEPLKLTAPNMDASEAPYFVDLVHEQLEKRVSDQELAHGSLRIYTSLDPELQQAAAEAVQVGIKNVDELVRSRHKKGDTNFTYPQVALVALNPHTGQILALVGGRNYGISQLNHAVAERPTGSIFKPFVYATAYNTSLNGTEFDQNGVFTAISLINDDPQTFMFDGKGYTPGNFERGEYPGMVTAVQALAHSLNIATIALAEHVGYENVAALARASGITEVRPTPSMAIGTYSATPIDMAGAYTVFANGGVHEQPWLLASVRNANGDIVADFAPTGKQVLDPRSAYLTQSLMENAMTFGTASAVRAHGFRGPGAGKTGTSHDAWFAGYTSNLLCIIWIGNDDYTDISRGLTRPVQGADTAAPIWAEFMNRAIKLPQYSDIKPFSPPDGVHQVRIDKNTWLPADDTCPQDYYIAFLDGTVPSSTCSHMGTGPGMLLPGLMPGAAPNPNSPAQPGQAQPAEPAPQKKNFFQRLFGSGNKQEQPQSQPQREAPQQ